MYQPTPPETEAKVRSLCADFLGGPWVNAKPDSVKIERLGGFINRNFAVTLRTDEVKVEGAPVKVMVHLYGNEIINSSANVKHNGEAAEAVITNELSKHGLAPKILGVFPGGRIEEFIPSQNTELTDFENTELVIEMGQKLAKIHSLTIPVRKTPDRLERLSKNTLLIPIRVDFGDVPESDKEDYYKFTNFPLETEVQEVSRIMCEIGSKPVFCHGDLNLSNILLRKDTNTYGQRLMTVDFEVSSYYYRGSDLAYFLHMRQFVPKMVSETEFDMVKLEDQNAERDMKILIEAYLKEWKSLHNNSLGPDDNLDHLTMETDFGKLVVSLSMICYMRYGNVVTKDTKAFKLHSKIIDEYLALKKETFEKYKQVIEQLRKTQN